MADNWEISWQRIVSHEGETFHQKTGKPFTYSVRGGAVHPQTTNRALPKSHFERAYRLMPLDGPGRIQHLQGPSYIWAILNDRRIRGTSDLDAQPEAKPKPPARLTTRNGPIPGTAVTKQQLDALGFQPLELEVLAEVDLAFAEVGTNWNTISDVPDSPGIYAFTVEDDSGLRVAYVGLTSNLWMVTKGRLPSGEARGGQRYGRPKHAGATRQRINTEVTQQLRHGRKVRHWVMPVPDPDQLRGIEVDLIKEWNLRLAGWNRS